MRPLTQAPGTGAQTNAVQEFACYKVVAVVGKHFLSIFDGQTVYKIGQVTVPEGGCWVCPSLSALAIHALRLPRRSALLEAPRESAVRKAKSANVCSALLVCTSGDLGRHES